MTRMPTLRAASTAARPCGRVNHAIAILAFGTAVVVTSEFIVIGLLPQMARDLGIPLAEAGRFVTWFALASAVPGPVLTIAASRMEPRPVLVLSMLTFGPGNLAATLLPDDATVAAVRVIQGAALPVFISIGAAAVADLAGPGRAGRALALVNVGVIAGIVVAMPAGVVLADGAGWSASFAGLGVLGTIAAALLAKAFPRLEGSTPASMKAQAKIVRQPAIQAHLLLSVLLFAAMFAAYSYLAAFLEAVAGLDGMGIALALAGFGFAGLLGNEIAGRVVDRAPTAATAGAALALALATASVSLAGDNLVLLLPLLAFWGAAHAAAFILCQVRVMLAAPGASAFASSLNISACNLGIALGAAAGGGIVERYGVGTIGFGSAALAAAALVLAIAMSARSLPRRTLPRPCGQ